MTGTPLLERTVRQARAVAEVARAVRMTPRAVNTKASPFLRLLAQHRFCSHLARRTRCDTLCSCTSTANNQISRRFKSTVAPAADSNGPRDHERPDDQDAVSGRYADLLTLSEPTVREETSSRVLVRKFEVGVNDQNLLDERKKRKFSKVLAKDDDNFLYPKAIAGPAEDAKGQRLFRKYPMADDDEKFKKEFPLRIQAATTKNNRSQVSRRPLLTMPVGNGKSSFQKHVALLPLQQRDGSLSTKQDDKLPLTQEKNKDPWATTRWDRLHESDFNRMAAPLTSADLTATGWKSRMAKSMQSYRKKSADEQETTSSQASFDYVGRAIRPIPSPVALPGSLPWALYRGPQRSPKSAMATLDHEIQRLDRYMRPSGQEFGVRKRVIQSFLDLARSNLDPSLSCFVFGSSTTDLAVATSDLDFTIAPAERDVDNNIIRRREVVPEETDSTDKSMRQAMKLLAKTLKGHEGFRSVTHRIAPTRRRTSNIINAQHKETGINIQILAGINNHRQYGSVIRYRDEIPHVRSLFVLLRTTLAMRGLNDVYNGGLGSYPLFAMIVASMIRRGSPVQESWGPGQRLLHFLSFYRNFDTSTKGLSFHPVKPFRKHNMDQSEWTKLAKAAKLRKNERLAARLKLAQTNRKFPYLLCLEDPGANRNDLGSKSFAIKHILSTFEFLEIKLRKGLEEMDAAHAIGVQWKGESLLEPFVGRCHEVYAREREKLLGAAPKDSDSDLEIGRPPPESPPEQEPALQNNDEIDVLPEAARIPPELLAEQESQAEPFDPLDADSQTEGEIEQFSQSSSTEEDETWKKWNE